MYFQFGLNSISFSLWLTNRASNIAKFMILIKHSSPSAPSSSLFALSFPLFVALLKLYQIGAGQQVQVMSITLLSVAHVCDIANNGGVQWYKHRKIGQNLNIILKYFKFKRSNQIYYNTILIRFKRRMLLYSNGCCFCDISFLQ